MATQRLTLAKIVGPAAQVLADRLSRWEQEALRLSPLAALLRANSMRPPIAYFCEWIDSWSMGDVIPGLGRSGAVVARDGCLEACCHRLPIAVDATMMGDMPEAAWLLARVTEAQAVNEHDSAVLVIVREVFGPSLADEDWNFELRTISPWLSLQT